MSRKLEATIQIYSSPEGGIEADTQFEETFNTDNISHMVVWHVMQIFIESQGRKIEESISIGGVQLKDIPDV